MNEGKKSIDELSESGFEDIIKDEYFISGLKNSQNHLNNSEIDDLWKRISKENKISKRGHRHRIYWITAIAGAAACVMFLLKIANWQEESVITVQHDDILAFVMKNYEQVGHSSEIQLVISHEKVIAIEEDNPAIVYGAEGVTVSEKMIIENISSFNQLIVPHGKRSVLTLSDSSKIWVNAGTRVVYPAVFQNDRREIFVDGEIFLDVAADTKRAFFVKTHQANVQVIGTKFNVMARKDENKMTVVLVSGVVDVFLQNNRHRLKPNDIYTYDEGKETVESGKIDKHISWKDGLFIIQSERLDEIAKRLSRYYGVRIICDPTAAPMKCSGRLVLSENLETVLDGITYAAPVVWSYDEDGSIKIKPK